MKNTESAVRAGMRSASHSCHVRINHHPLLRGLASRESLLSDYCIVLIAYFHLFDKLETRIDEFLKQTPVAFDYSKRTKLSWLEQDLLFFNKDPYHESNLPANPVDFPEINNVGQLIGLLYAIEGSTLGGQLISVNLSQNHNLTIVHGARFFNGYAENTGSHWEEFCRFADSIQNNLVVSQFKTEG